MNIPLKVGNIQVSLEDVETIIFGLKLGIPEGSHRTKLLLDFEELRLLLGGSDVL
jgi:hypothetical protein